MYTSLFDSMCTALYTCLRFCVLIVFKMYTRIHFENNKNYLVESLSLEEKLSTKYVKNCT